MTALTTQLIGDAGTAPTFGAATTSDTAEIGSGKDTFAVYKNTSGSPATLTIVVPNNNDYGQPNPDPAIVIPATTGEKWLMLRKDYDDGTGRAGLTLSSATGITVAIVRAG